MEGAARCALPTAYNFELEKTVRRLDEAGARSVCLQFPEGLLVWAESIAHILRHYAATVQRVIIMGDVTYGACCIDDVKAAHLGCDFLVHYGHSCLVPVDSVNLKCLYVFVRIDLDPVRLVDHLAHSFPLELEEASGAASTGVSGKASAGATSTGVSEEAFAGAASTGVSEEASGGATSTGVSEEASAGATSTGAQAPTRIALLATIQFSKCLHQAATMLTKRFGKAVYVPQCAPLTPGETLGCTSPKLEPNTKMCVFISDGRFHIESAMIANPHVALFYRYDPFMKQLYREEYDVDRLLALRNGQVERAFPYRRFVILLSTLGRQGSVGLAEHVREQILSTWANAEVYTLMVSELVPATLRAIGDSACFVNVGCPRLAIDWGHELGVCLLTTYELQQVLRRQKLLTHPMDYFASDGGVWSNYARPRNGTIAKQPADVQARLRALWKATKQQQAV